MGSEEILQHYGVPGMRWGKRKAGAAKQRVKDELKSLSRERSWKKSLTNMDTMSIKDLNKLANRIQMENDLKRLSKKSEIANKNDKQDYRNRANISDKDLLDRVSKLRAKENLYRTVREASKDQREIGMRVTRTVAGVGVKYALTGTVSTKDIGMAAINPLAYNKNLNKNTMNQFLDKTNKTILNDKRKTKV